MAAHQIYKGCKKDSKLGFPPAPKKWVQGLFPLFGVLSLVWFLVRVIPKPHRATYPCMRVAAPLASSFVTWLIGLVGSAGAMHIARKQLRGARYIRAALCVLAASVTVLIGLYGSENPPASASHPAGVQSELGVDTVNDPIGVARGSKPGRVAWVHNPEATDWEGPSSGEPCWESGHINQEVVDSMMSNAVRWLTGKPNDIDAWDALFRYINLQKRNEDRGYQLGEKIAIKINLTLCHVSGSANPQTRMLNRYLDKAGNTNPQMIMALLRQLVNEVGVVQTDISVGDPVNFFPQQWYDYLSPEFPAVHYLDHYPFTGRTQVQFSNTLFAWSTPESIGKVQDYLPVSFADADYFINFAVLKSHIRAGITVCAKNHYGSLIRSPPGDLWGSNYDYYHLHDNLPCDGAPGQGIYRTLVDLMGHTDLGGKTVLYLIDGLFGGQGWSGTPYKWNIAPFNSDWPSSLFASQDPVAIDSVAYDFLLAEWPQLVSDSNCGAGGAQDYLHEAAFANDPPSETFYDPENDGTALVSLGVHEHWNNPIDKQYSRNLGTGEGIKLISSYPGDFNVDGDIDGSDVAEFGQAYADQNPAADLNDDGTIDGADVAVFAAYFGRTN